MLKKFVRSDVGQYILCRLIYLIILLGLKSTRWTIIDPHGHRHANSEIRSKPVIGVFWHNRIMLGCVFWEKIRPTTMLISLHADGRMIANAVNLLGVQTIDGSSSKNGAKAFRGLVNALKDGGDVAITPDGPRGPRMRCKESVVTLARLSGAAVIPVAWNVKRRKVLSSWDRFIVASPFSQGVVVWGKETRVPKDASKDELEDFRLEIEKSLNDASTEADTFFGHSPIQPDDVKAGK